MDEHKSKMPKLLQVEAARRAIEAHFASKKNRCSVLTNDFKVINCISPSELESALAKKTIVGALARARTYGFASTVHPFLPSNSE